MSSRIRAKLEPNDIIKRSKTDYNWRVIALLGTGGYGSVNKVIQVNETGVAINEKQFAMKSEVKRANKQASRLKIERNVMGAFTKCDAQYRIHFPELIDLGQTQKFKWIVMTLVGASLEKLKQKTFSLSTALQCGLQTMKAIRDLHLVGFLHRDIKPANYCIGVGAKMELVYLLDFGLARKYRQQNGQLRVPRTKTKMVGTPRYCPRASHRMEELGRKDDYESWFYMLLDFVDRDGGVQWKGKPKEVAHTLKKKIFDEPKWISTVSLVPPDFATIVDYINSLTFSSDVEFGVLREVITDYARSVNLTLREKLDWMIEPKATETSVSKKAMTPSSQPASMPISTCVTSKMGSSEDNRSVNSDKNEESSLDYSKNGTRNNLSRKFRLMK